MLTVFETTGCNTFEEFLVWCRKHARTTCTGRSDKPYLDELPESEFLPFCEQWWRELHAPPARKRGR